MRRFPTLVVTALSLLVAAGIAAILYKQAWRIPFVQNYRGMQLGVLLWILVAPVVMLLAPLTRLSRWVPALKGCAIFAIVALPAFALATGAEKVRASSRDKAVLCNLRQLAAAADQYFLENNVRVVPSIEALVGPRQYIKALNPIAGEHYQQNFPFSADGHGVYFAEFPNGRLLCYYANAMLPGYQYVYEPGEEPLWKQPPPSPKSDQRVLQKNPLSAQPTSLVATNEEPPRKLGRPSHQVRRGTMCASCHAKKS